MWRILLQKALKSCNNWHQNSFMSLKAINESYRTLLARALRSTVAVHIKKYMRQVMAMLLAGVTSNGGNAIIRGSAFSIVMAITVKDNDKIGQLNVFLVNSVYRKFIKKNFKMFSKFVWWKLPINSLYFDIKYTMLINTN